MFEWVKLPVSSTQSQNLSELVKDKQRTVLIYGMMNVKFKVEGLPVNVPRKQGRTLTLVIMIHGAPMYTSGVN
eukprot:9496822-Pyramimonas_sp.AAC.1